MRSWTDAEREIVSVIFNSEIRDERKYRYYFSFTWDEDLDITTLLMLNPSVTDEDIVDPTIDRCIKFIRNHIVECGSLIVVNLFPYITPDPKQLFKQSYNMIVGTDNLKFIEGSMSKSRWVIAAWGADGANYHMNHKVLKLMDKYSVSPLCFGKTKYGHPVHASPKNTCEFNLEPFDI